MLPMIAPLPGLLPTIMDEGGEIGFTHLPDRPDDEKRKNRRRVTKCTDQYPEQTKFVVPMNVQDDGDIASVMETAKQEFGEIDFLLHSIAFADRDDLSRDTVETSRDGFKMAMEISAYSLIAVANAAKDIIKENGSIATMTYFGGEKCVPGLSWVSVSGLKQLPMSHMTSGLRELSQRSGWTLKTPRKCCRVGEMQPLVRISLTLRNVTQK